MYRPIPTYKPIRPPKTTYCRYRSADRTPIYIPICRPNTTTLLIHRPIYRPIPPTAINRSTRAAHLPSLLAAGWHPPLFLLVESTKTLP